MNDPAPSPQDSLKPTAQEILPELFERAIKEKGDDDYRSPDPVEVALPLSNGAGANTAELTEEVLHFEGPLTATAQTATKGVDDSTETTAMLFRLNEAPQEFELEDLAQILADDKNFVWLDLSNYSEPTLRKVATLLQLHPLSLRAALSAWQRPRYDKFPNHFLITVTVAHLNSTSSVQRVLAGELDLFVGDNFLVSVHKLPLPFMERIIERASQSPEAIKLDVAFMLYLVLDELLEYYEELSDHIEIENEKMEQRALKDTSDNFLADLLQYKRYVFALNRLADQHRKVFAALLRPDNSLAAAEGVGLYFHDLEAHFERLLDTLQPAKEAVNGAFDIYVSHVSHRTNQVIKTLTLVSTVLLPATLIISLFGTNIVGVNQSGLFDFALMILSIVITVGIILFVFRRRGWI